MTTRNVWRLARRPSGDIADGDLVYATEALPPLADGQFSLGIVYLSLDPTNRIWMSDQEQYMPPVPIGSPMRGGVVGRVLESRKPGVNPGDTYAGLGEWADIVPVSATDGYQVDVLADVIVGLLQPGPALYPDGELTDEPESVMVAELVREAALEGVRDELPHSLAVVVDEIVPREGPTPMLDVRVNLFVERDSQKAIIIGRGGARLREVGSEARRGIEALLGTRVFLDLHVKVAKDWQRDPKQLGRMGF